MKILCVIDSLGSGGAQRQLVNLAIGYKEENHDVIFLVYHNNNFFEPILREHNIPIHVINTKNHFKRVFSIIRYIKNNNFDVVQSFLDVPNFICELASLPKKRWKLIVGERSSNPNLLNSSKAKFLRYFHRYADFIVANSHSNIDLVKQLNTTLPAEKLKVIYNSIDFELYNAENFKIINKDVNLMRKKLLIAASHRYLKNSIGLVEATNLLSDCEKNLISIDWYGHQDDKSFEDTLERVKKYNLQYIFNFYDQTDKIKEKMVEADFIGLFSHYEGFPNTISEAMALKKTVISSSVSDIPYIVESKFLFPSNDFTKIAEVLRTLINLSSDDLEIIGIRNHEKAKSLFDKNKIVKQYLELFCS